MTASPAPVPLNADIKRRFTALGRLYGAQIAERLAQAHVVVVGIGGVGSWAAEALARSGVGRLTLIDLDHIAESNINRQVHALTPTVGMAKVGAMAERIALINPTCQVASIEEFVGPDNWPAILGAALPDAVIDACDNLWAKAAMASWALQQRSRHGAPRGSIKDEIKVDNKADKRQTHFITVGAAGGKREAHRAQVADIACATHDPLLAKLRARLRREHGAKAASKNAKIAPIGVQCVFSDEPVTRPQECEGPDAQAAPTDGSLNCHGWGSSVVVTASFGLVAASAILNRIARQAS